MRQTSVLLEPLAVHSAWSDNPVTYTDEFGDIHAGYKCSFCGSVALKTSHCPHCGAIMDIEEDIKCHDQLTGVAAVLDKKQNKQLRKRSRY